MFLDSPGPLGYFPSFHQLDYRWIAEVAELADARDSKSRAPCGHGGSTPPFGTTLKPASRGRSR